MSIDPAKRCATVGVDKEKHPVVCASAFVCGVSQDEVIPNYYNYQHLVDSGWVSTYDVRYCDPYKDGPAWICKECARPRCLDKPKAEPSTLDRVNIRSLINYVNTSVSEVLEGYELSSPELINVIRTLYDDQLKGTELEGKCVVNYDPETETINVEIKR